MNEIPGNSDIQHPLAVHNSESGGADRRSPILEVAILNIRAGTGGAFETAFREASPIIASMPGYLSHELRQCIEAPHRYILLVHWQCLENHTVGFRQSAQYQQWRALLHHFYDPFPTVEHYGESLVDSGLLNPAGFRIHGIDHVQLAMPAGEEAVARTFYAGILGLKEIPKPENLVQRGGVWFASGDLRIHLGIEADFRPARKAHPALLVERLDALTQHLHRSGIAVVSDETLEGYDRIYVADPFGNRIELLERIGA